ncbi:E3 ubiquitin/ISG15 ligase TRIM25-like [Cebidichthys violaceus]|uniref:E3 ubiquitin/ISG15 ligase TRIM25-like n=1 Tax=Cebidichthys violaceus TaxID=271503 RepID=UPI0035C9CDD4
MSAASCLLTEDQFLCSICLDVFTDPVTIPCGHNFCKTCITKHWNMNVQSQCPNCNKLFDTRPELQVNTFISEMAAQFRQSAQQKASSRSSSEQQAAKPGEVPCDVCTGTKLKALKSCLVCLASYCETHLEPHLTRSGLKRHQLINPVENLEGRMCTEHDKLLELFCKTDQICVCKLCTVLDHKNHDVVPLKEEYEGKKTELGKTEAEIQQMIKKRRLKIQEIKHSVELSEEDADREISDGVQVFTALKESVERSQAELIDTIKEKQRKKKKQAEGFIKELEQEISELKKKSTEVEQLSNSEDHLHLLQSFRTLNTAPPTKNWTGDRVSPPSHEGTVVRAVNQLEETLSKQMKKLLTEAELKRVQQSTVDVPRATAPWPTVSLPRATAPQPTVSVPRATAPRPTVSLPRETDPRPTVSVPRETDPGPTVSMPRETDPWLTVSVLRAAALWPTVLVPRETDPGPTVSVPRETNPRPTVSVPRATAPRRTVSLSRATAPRPTVSLPRATAPRPTVSVPRDTDPRSTVSVPRDTDPRSTVSVPREIDPWPTVSVSRAATLWPPTHPFKE